MKGTRTRAMQPDVEPVFFQAKGLDANAGLPEYRVALIFGAVSVKFGGRRDVA